MQFLGWVDRLATTHRFVRARRWDGFPLRGEPILL